MKHLCVNDLGIAAYLMMHKFKVVGRKAKSIYFEVDDKDEQEFEALQMDYLSSEYHRFDSCLMSLKKLNEYMPKGER
jgi:hypothetical protein